MEGLTIDNTDRSKTIVLADNEPFVVHAYKSGLEEAGYVVAVAEDGEEAVRQILALQPDVVLLELILPKQDGFAVLKTVKADPVMSAIPVVVLTSLSQESDIAEARTCGAADVMIKTEVSLNDVLLCIDRLLNRS